MLKIWDFCIILWKFIILINKLRFRKLSMSLIRDILCFEVFETLISFFNRCRISLFRFLKFHFLHLLYAMHILYIHYINSTTRNFWLIIKLSFYHAILQTNIWAFRMLNLQLLINLQLEKLNCTSLAESLYWLDA